MRILHQRAPMSEWSWFNAMCVFVFLFYIPIYEYCICVALWGFIVIAVDVNAQLAQTQTV